MFHSVVSDLRMFETAREDLISQSLSGCLVVLTVVKEQFADLRLKDVYEILTTMPALDSDELALTLVQEDEDAEEDEVSGEDKEEKVDSPLR